MPRCWCNKPMKTKSFFLDRSNNLKCVYIYHCDDCGVYLQRERDHITKR